jgi:hypothetical protein
MIKKFVLALILIGAIAAAGFWYWTTTPQYAVKQAADAIKRHDVAAFQYWVDVHNVANAAVEDVLAAPVRDVGGSGLLERIVGFGIFSILRPTVVTSLEKQIVTSVARTGMDPTQTAAQPQGPKGIIGTIVDMVKPPSLTETLRDYGFTKQNYRGVGEVKTMEDRARVDLRFFIPRQNAETAVSLGLLKWPNGWRIIRIVNLQDIVKDVVGVGGEAVRE